MAKMKTIDYLIAALLFAGALNWGLIGFFEFNLVSWLFQWWTLGVRIVYGAVGIAAVVGALRFPWGR